MRLYQPLHARTATAVDRERCARLGLQEPIPQSVVEGHHIRTDHDEVLAVPLLSQSLTHSSSTGICDRPLRPHAKKLSENRCNPLFFQCFWGLNAGFTPILG